MSTHVPVTPSRGSDRDRLPFPYTSTPQSHRSTSASSSTTTPPPSIPASTSTPSNSSSTPSAKPTTAPISLASLLAAHASAPNPHAAALDQALSERNLLSSQNSQLWKLIEKQRSGYNQLLKELERLRAERDSLRARFGSGGKDKTLKSSLSSSAVSTTSSGGGSSTSANGVGGTSADVDPATARNHSDNKTVMPRHEHQNNSSQDRQPQSQSHPTSNTNSHAGGQKISPPPLIVTSSKSLPGMNPDTSTSAPSSASGVSPGSALSSDTPQTTSIYPQLNQIQGPPPSPRPSHNHTGPGTSLNVTNSSSSGSQSLNPNPSHLSGQLQYPPRRSSMLPPGPGIIAGIPSSSNTAPNVSSFSLSNPNLTQKSSVYSSSNSSLNDAQLVVHPPPTPEPGLQQHTTAYSPMMQAALANPQSLSSAGPTMLSPTLEPSGLHRESRISLPDEAKRYIANMGDSPVPSPRLGGFAVQGSLPAPQPQSAPSELSWSSQVVTSTPNPAIIHPSSLMANPSANPDPGEGEFLDMEDGDHDDENEDEDAEGGNDGEDEKELDDEDPDSVSYRRQQQQSRKQAQQQMQSPFMQPTQPLAMNGIIARPDVEDFPLPPNFSGQHVQGQTPHVHMQVQQAQAHAQARAQTQAQGLEYHQPQVPSQRSRGDPEIGGSYSPYLSNAPSSSSSTSLMNSSQTQSQTTTTSPAFRALPLLATDLPNTRITVSHSSIRPNDRGKEVLSFIIVVDPGRGKDTWKVEKLYSDVLGLDQRVRASVGKGVGKKIASLPEGKLWRDHAPAKVDQRKVALESYLQTLINLPVKNKDEVIAFFCSDIVRETRKPVYQAGYKEGYLTKRGKNFGGWKTRYFVLQGPVLEYYESRGGTHLGSITITGAQIGRQQRTGDRRESDDEKEYRHAFLIIEAKKVSSGSGARHVLCAESDADRDNWVEVLVRYIMGSYNDDPVPSYGPSGQAGPLSINTSASVTQQQGGTSTAAQPRSSTSSNAPNGDNVPSPSTARRPNRGMSKDDIAKGPAVPISQLAPDVNNKKLFQAPPHEDLRPSSPMKSMDPSPIDRDDGAHTMHMLDKGQAPLDVPLSSSLPTTSPLDVSSTVLVSAPNQRANSELGHYSDLQEQRDSRQGQGSPERHRQRDQYRARKSFHPTLNTVASAPNTPKPIDLEPSVDTSRAEAHAKAKISAPLGGTVIPAGYKFGGKDAPTESGPSTADRREKAKSRSFWGFGKNASADKHPAHAPRAVFGVTLDESLDVAEIANLPAVVFRCIQYLETKKADQEEGIYRLSGSSAVIKSLKDKFNMEGDVDLLSSDEYWDPHAIAGLLKSFLRELPASILTRDLHLRFLSVIDFVDPQERIKELSHLIASLPIANYSLLRALTAHLILIVQNAGVNKMTMRNVGIVFSPTLGIPAGVFSLMLGEFNRVFNVDGLDEDVQDQDDNSSAADHLSRRNSRQYTDTAADQLLGLSGRTLTSPVEEGQSDADSLSVDYESPESTEDSATSVRSSPDNNTSLEVPTTPKASKASHAAATRGLNIAVINKGNRHSRSMGLPASPRPMPSPNSHPLSNHVIVSVPQTPK